MNSRQLREAASALIDSLLSLNEEVSEDWFKTGTFQAFKIPNPIHYETATGPGVTQTLEGPVRHDVGHKIVTGPKGEKYPIAPEKFASLYDDQGNGMATPKKIMKMAKLADHDGVLHTSWGDLAYKAGQHYIVRHGDGDYGAIEKDIFSKTYGR
jgi:hypothetical protein